MLRLLMPATVVSLFAEELFFHAGEDAVQLLQVAAKKHTRTTGRQLAMGCQYVFGRVEPTTIDHARALFSSACNAKHSVAFCADVFGEAFSVFNGVPGNAAWKDQAEHHELFCQSLTELVEDMFEDLKEPAPGFDAEAYASTGLFDIGFYNTIADYLRPYAEGQRVVDLGAHDGFMGTLLGAAAELVSVDPFPPDHLYGPVVKMGGVEYLQTREDRSLDFVFSVCALHFMNADELHKQSQRVLSTDGKAIHFSVSRQTPFFLNDSFNELFFSKGWGPGGYIKPAKPVPQNTIPITIPCTSDKFRQFIMGRAWSNLTPQLWSDDQLKYLAAMIPGDLHEVLVHLNVRKFGFDREGHLKHIG